METDSLSENGIWFEEHNYVFDSTVALLRLAVSSENNPLILLSMAALFHNLNDTYHENTTLSKIENALKNLSRIQDSGLQLRDCLFVSGYDYLMRKICDSDHDFDKIINPRIEYAAGQEWFDDPKLAAIVALSAKNTNLQDNAQSFLKSNATRWTERDNIVGVLCFCLTQADISEDLITYLSKYDWQKDDLVKLTWGLLVLGWLVRKGYKLNHIQIIIANRINNILRLNKPTNMAIDQSIESQNASQTISFDIAFAAYALNQEGFDRIVGVQAHKRRNLEQLLAIQQELANGGRLISKKLYMVLMGVVFIFLGIIVWQLTNLAGLDQFWAALLGIVLASLLTWVWYSIVQKENPLVKTIPILGEVTEAEDILDEENGES